jgi:hypothetical protein
MLYSITSILHHSDLFWKALWGPLVVIHEREDPTSIYIILLLEGAVTK